jgi:hypothetical protein
MHTCNHSTWKAEAGKSQVWGQHGLHSMRPCHKIKQKTYFHAYRGRGSLVAASNDDNDSVAATVISTLWTGAVISTLCVFLFNIHNDIVKKEQAKNT